MLLRDLVTADVTLPEGAGAIEIKGITADSRAVAPGFLFAALPGSKTDGARFVADAVARGAVGGARRRATPLIERRLGVAGPPRRRSAPRAGAARGALLSAPAGAARRGDRHQRQDLGRRLRPPDLRGGRPRGGEHRHDRRRQPAVDATYGSLTTPDPVALHADARPAGRRGRHPRRARGVEPRPRPAPARRHPHRGGRLHQSRPRPHGLPSRRSSDYLAAKLRLFTVDPAEGRRGGGRHGRRAFAKTSRRRRGSAASTLIRVGRNGQRDPHRRHRRRTASSSGSRSRPSASGATCVLPLAGAFQASNALVAAGLAIAAGVDAGRRLRRARRPRAARPAGSSWSAGRPNGALVFVDYAHKPDALASVLKALRPHDRRAARRRLRRRRRPRPRQAPADGRGRGARTPTSSSSPTTIRAAKIRRRSARRSSTRAPGAHRDRRPRARRSAAPIAMLGPGDVLCIAGKGHETGQIVGDRDAAVLRPRGGRSGARRGGGGMSAPLWTYRRLRRRR